MSGVPAWLLVVVALLSTAVIWIGGLWVGLKAIERDQRKGGRRGL